jgi:hypothetical protein
LRGGKDVFDEVGRKMGKERNLMTGQKKVEKNLKIEDGISNYLDFFSFFLSQYSNLALFCLIKNLIPLLLFAFTYVIVYSETVDVER